MKPLRGWGYLFLTTLLLGCQAAGSKPSEDIPSGWQRIDADGRFSFYLPPDMQPLETRGIDSLVQAFRGGGLHLLYDYGRFSDPLDYGEKAEYKEETVKIGDKSARVVTYYDLDSAHEFKYVAAIHFPDVGAKQAKLTVFVNCKDPADQATAKRIFYSIRFR